MNDAYNQKLSPTIDNLKILTKEFFTKHLNFIKEIPEWSEPWEYKDTIPNNDKPGCYVLLKNNAEGKIIDYIGVGAGKNPGKYLDAGLGARLHNYWIYIETKEENNGDLHRIYTQVKEWEHINAIITIGFPPEFGYMAYALEAFLRFNIKTDGNKY
jgi:hypothetical protein